MRLLSISEQLAHRMHALTADRQGRFREVAAKLDMLNPLGVLLRGYGIAYDEKGRAVSSANDVAVGEPFCFRLHDGEVCGRVEQVVREEKDRG